MSADPIEALPAAVPEMDGPPAPRVATAVPVARPVAKPVAAPAATVEAAPTDDFAPDFRAFKQQKANDLREGRRAPVRPQVQDDTMKKVALYAGIPLGGILLILALSTMFRSSPPPPKKDTSKVQAAPPPSWQVDSPSTPRRTGRMTGELFGDTDWQTPGQARESYERNKR